MISTKPSVTYRAKETMINVVTFFCLHILALGVSSFAEEQQS